MIKIECVSLSNLNHDNQRLVIEQHKLRYKEVISKENWENIYIYDDMEFDQYDNIATEYIVAKNENNEVVGVTRLYPTTLPYMLENSFEYLSHSKFPSTPHIMEASRLVLDRDKLDKSERRPVIDKLILAYMERGLQRQIQGYVGFMLPKIWESTFIRVGWDVQWLGETQKLKGSNDVVRAAYIPVSEEIEANIRQVTGIKQNVLPPENAVIVPNSNIYVNVNSPSIERLKAA
jgi:N-acyl-L-homoserine lactone synthetase